MPTGDPERLAELTRTIRREFPRFRIVTKTDSRLQRLIHWGLAAVTAGRMRSYLTGYQTTLGQVVYVTPDWDQLCCDRRYVILRHERIHMRQFRDLTAAGMTAIYGALPLPMGLSWGRAMLEKQAYAETIRAAAEVWGVDAVREPAFRDRIIGQFTGPSYAWMWPFPQRIAAWYDRVVSEVAGG